MGLLKGRWQADKEYLALVEDLLENEKFQKLGDITHHHYTTRLQHSIYVSYVSYKLAKRMNLDVRAIARAGLLHDFFLESREEIEAMEEGSHNYVHPKIALKNAKEITPISKLEEDIILKHMFLCTTCAFPSYQESAVVTCVDKYCALSEVTKPFRQSSMEILNRFKRTITLTNW